MDWTAENLLADTAWMRDLAGRLVGDTPQADDLVQDTWVLALRGGEPPSRAWLGGVLRKLSFTRRRSEGRRLERERRAARPEGGPDAAWLLARIEGQQLLAEALLALDEPYRSALGWHYLEGLEAREIAERCGSPASTVHSRLRRGIEALRAELHRRRPGEGWLAALVPLAWGPRGATPVAMGSAGWGLKVGLGAAALVVLVWGGRQALGERKAPAAVETADAEPVAMVTAAPAASPVPSPTAPAAREPQAAPVEGETPDPGPALWSLGLTVVDAAQRPVEGAGVTAVLMRAGEVESHLLGFTDDAGGLEHPLDVLNNRGWATWNAGGASLVVSHADHAVTTHDLPLAERDGPERLDLTLVLAATAGLSGRVLDSDGSPLAGVELRLFTEDETFRGYTLSAHDGVFAFPALSGQRGFVTASTQANRAVSATLPLDPGDLGDLRMQRLASLRGRILDRDGKPARGVWVQVRARGEVATPRAADGSPRPGHAWAQAATDSAGRFAFDGLRLGTYRVETSQAVDPPGEVLVDLPAPELELRLTGSRLLVRVEDVYGRPEVGVEVFAQRASEEGPSQSSWTWPPAGITAFEVEPGASYHVVVPGRGGLPQEETVTIPEDAVEVERVYVTGKPIPTCSLRVLAEGPEGKRLRVTQVALLGANTETYLAAYDELIPDAEGWVHGLPEGSFQVGLHVARADREPRGLYLEKKRHRVDLTPGVPAEVRVRAVRGGRVSLELVPAAWPADSPQAPRPDDEAYLEHLKAHGLRATLTPLGGDGRPRPRQLARPFVRDGVGGLVPWWLPGEVHLHWSAEPPGLYTLTVRGEAWEEVEREVELVAGETSAIRVVLNPR